MEIIASSPIIPRTEYTLAHCVVIRENNTEYVVHMKTWDREGNVGYHTGNYFQKRAYPKIALLAAWDKFTERARRTLTVEA
jgi:hypothetical protein